MTLHQTELAKVVRSRGTTTRQLACFAFAAYVVLSSFGHLFLGEQLASGFIDEIAVAAFGVLAITVAGSSLPGAPLRILAVALLIFTWGSVSALSNPLLIGAPLRQLIGTASLIDLKPYFVAASFLMILLSMDRRNQIYLIRYICVTFVLLSLFNLVFCLLDILRGADIHGRALETRAGIPVPNGIYELKFMSAFTSLMGFICILALQPTFRSRNLYRLLLGTMGFGLLIALSAKEIIAAFAVLALSVSAGQRGWRLFAILGLSALVILLTSTDNPLSEAINGRFNLFLGGRVDTVRAAMYVKAPTVANDFFPLGAGWGTFGSSASRDVFYSPLYGHYGISTLWGGSVRYGSFLVDTFWPKIIGEQGWIGFAIYIWLWLLCGRTAVKLAFKTNRDLMANFGLYSFFALLLVSAATPVYNYADGCIVSGIGMALLFPSMKRKGRRNRLPPRRVRGPGLASTPYRALRS